MKRALLFLSLLAALDQVLGLGLLWIFHEVRSGQNGGAINLTLERRAPLLITGSSRAQHHFNPHVLEERLGIDAFNAGADGQGIYYSVVLLDLVLRAYTPSVVLWNLDYKDLDERGRETQIRRLSVLLPFYEKSPVLRDIWGRMGASARLKLASRTYHINSIALPNLANLFRTPDGVDGFLPLPDRNGEFLSPYFDQPLAEPDPLALSVLSSALHRCAELGVRSALINGPHHWADGSPEEYRRRFGRLFEQLAHENAGTVFWDMDEASLSTFRDSRWFWDSGHLNVEGANLFTTMVADRLPSFLGQKTNSGPGPKMMSSLTDPVVDVKFSQYETP